MWYLFQPMPGWVSSLPYWRGLHVNPPVFEKCWVFCKAGWFFRRAWKPFFWNILEKRPVSKHRWSNHTYIVQPSGQSFVNFFPSSDVVYTVTPFSPRLSHSPLEITNAWAQTWRGRRDRAKVNSAPALQQLLKNSVYPGHKPCCSAVFCFFPPTDFLAHEFYLHIFVLFSFFKQLLKLVFGM